MKIPREAMTPELDAAIRSFIGDGAWFRLSAAGPSGDPDRARSLLRSHCELESALGFGVLFTAVSAALIGLFLLGGESPALLLVPAVFAAGTVGLALRLRAKRPDGPQPTTEFLEAALPRLYLAPVQRRYAEALIAVYGEKVRDPGGEGLTLLRHLAEEETRLQTLARTVEVSPPAEVIAEVESLRSRLAGARDLAARDALAQSVALAEGRLETAERASGVRERLEAHRALLDQASLAASEGIMGWGDLTSGLDNLRANVASLGREAKALEAAVEEMRSLSPASYG